MLTIEEFLAFTAEPPDGERWELIEGIGKASLSTAWRENRTAGAWVLPALGSGVLIPLAEAYRLTPLAVAD